ncbi:MAG: hypothetical protein RJQ21_09885 [Rhodospirillales bacterium]
MARKEPSEMHKARRGKNLLLGLALVGFCVLFYVITIAKMG